MSRVKQKNVVGAVVQDRHKRFLITWNDEWQGYSFPVNEIPIKTVPKAGHALNALENDLSVKLPNSRGSNLEFIVTAGYSLSTRELTSYDAWLFQIEPNESEEALVRAIDQLNQTSPHPPLWLSHEEIKTRSDVTWSAVDLVMDFVDNEEVVVSIVARPGVRDTEVLLIWNKNFQGYFFPAQRIKTPDGCESIAASTIAKGLGYPGEVAARYLTDVTNLQQSERYDSTRHYRFHLCETKLPKVDLHFPYGAIELFLARRGHRFKWVEIGQLLDPATQATTTMDLIARYVPLYMSGKTISSSTRKSKGVVVLFERNTGNQRKWLLRRHQEWEKFTLIFGAWGDAPELGNAVARTLEEKLGVVDGGLEGNGDSETYLNFHAISRSTGELTHYQYHVVTSGLDQCVINQLEEIKGFIWASDDEILELEDKVGRPIHETALSILLQAGILKNESAKEEPHFAGEKGSYENE